MAHLFIGFQSLVKFIFSLTQAHDVDIFRVEIKADLFSNHSSSCGMDKPFVAVLVIAADFIVHSAEPVSYTHLDVYKRQEYLLPSSKG